MQRDFIVDAAFGIHVQAESVGDALERFTQRRPTEQIDHMAYRKLSARPADTSTAVQSLIVTVSRRGFTRSPWDSYVKRFRDHDGATAEEHFLTWWTSLDPTGYTRRLADVEIYRVVEQPDLIAKDDPGELSACPAFPPVDLGGPR